MKTKQEKTKNNYNLTANSPKEFIEKFAIKYNISVSESRRLFKEAILS